jgi:RimJ/RimL family protein N-acetyltransferase
MEVSMVNIIRKASPRDLNDINAIIDNQPEKNGGYRYPCALSERDISQNERGSFFVAEVDEEIIAFLSLHGRNLFEESSEAEFEIVVLPEHQENHHGEKLLKHVIEYAKNETKIIRLIAKITRDNTPSIKLCEKCGFPPVVEERDKMNKGFVMTLHINR